MVPIEQPIAHYRKLLDPTTAPMATEEVADGAADCASSSSSGEWHTCTCSAHTRRPGIGLESTAHKQKAKANKPRLSGTERGHWDVLVAAAAC